MSNLTNINSALASASESPLAHGAGEGSGRAFTIGLVVVFFAVMMVCLVAGASIYRSVEGIRSEANDLHMESGLLVNIVRMNDSADAVQVA
ncbi:MAG: hypothetical protein IJG88_04845, partial [Eggerthellaceae bacterium]|nr:hypothetical protein [Eggerthellaceae bacterium]